MKEKWLDIKGYEGLYQVSNLGRIKSIPHIVNTIDKRGWEYSYIAKEKILKNVKGTVGYAQVNLYGHNKTLIVKNVHRIVAIHFIKNPHNKKFVNHKDGNKMNTSASNLEWCTASENMRHAYDVLNIPVSGLGKFGKDSNKSVSVIQLTLDGKIVKRWDSMSDAWRAKGFRPDGICRACSGHNKSYKGYKWKYADKNKSTKKINRSLL